MLVRHGTEGAHWVWRGPGSVHLDAVLLEELRVCELLICQACLFYWLGLEKAIMTKELGVFTKIWMVAVDIIFGHSDESNFSKATYSGRAASPTVNLGIDVEIVDVVPIKRVM